MNLEDQHIVQLLTKNQIDEGFSLIVKKYSQKIYWQNRRMLVNHEDAEDVTQNCFIKLYKNISKFKGESQLYTWIYRICTNECLTYIEERKKKQINYSDYLYNQVKNEIEVNEKTIDILFQQALQLLPEKQKIVFTLRYYDELPFETIAEILKSSISAAKSNYHFAAEKIKGHLKEQL